MTKMSPGSYPGSRCVPGDTWVNTLTVSLGRSVHVFDRGVRPRPPLGGCGHLEEVARPTGQTLYIHTGDGPGQREGEKQSERGRDEYEQKEKGEDTERQREIETHKVTHRNTHEEQ